MEILSCLQTAVMAAVENKRKHDKVKEWFGMEPFQTKKKRQS